MGKPVDVPPGDKDFGSITSFLEEHAPGIAWLPRWVQQKLVPAMVGSAATALFIGVAYFFNSPEKEIQREKEINQEAIVDVKKSLAEFSLRIDQALALLQHTETEQAGMKAQLDGLTRESESARQWRDDLAREAATPPHARRKR